MPKKHKISHITTTLSSRSPNNNIGSLARIQNDTSVLTDIPIDN